MPAAPREYGQPLPEVAVADTQGLITPERMREIVMKVGTPAACINATLDFASGVKLAIRNVDPSKPADPEEVNFIEHIMRRPNRQDDGLEFKQRIIRDLFTMGMAAIEIERGENGGFANLNPLDTARLRIDFDEHGYVRGYDMLNIYGMPIHYANNEPYAWRPEEVILIRRDPTTQSVYGLSRISQLFTYAVVEDLILTYISQRFTDSNVPRGVMDLGDITEDELRRAINNWNAQADSSHRILLTSSKGQTKWWPFNYNLSELQAKDLVAHIRQTIMGILGVTMNELGESQDVSKANGYNLSFTFKKRAVEPVLNAICEKLTTRFLWDTLGLTHLEYYYHEIDSRDELMMSQIDAEYLKHGVCTINQIRNRRGDPSVPGGDVSMVFSGSAWIPTALAEEFAHIQLELLRAELQLIHAQIAQASDPAAQGQGQGGAQKSPVSLPLVRAPGMPDRFTTPYGAGSSTAKVMYPQAKPPKPQPQSQSQAGRTHETQSDIGQTPRGPKQTMRAAGMRQVYEK